MKVHYEYAGCCDGSGRVTHVCYSPQGVRHAGMCCRWWREVRDGEHGPWKPYNENGQGGS